MEDEKHLIVVPVAHEVTRDGSTTEFFTYGNMDDNERCEAVAQEFGVEREDVSVLEAKKTRGRRLSVGFNKWRSKWEPHAGRGDPNLN